MFNKVLDFICLTVAIIMCLIVIMIPFNVIFYIPESHIVTEEKPTVPQDNLSTPQAKYISVD